MLTSTLSLVTSENIPLGHCSGISNTYKKCLNGRRTDPALPECSECCSSVDTQRNWASLVTLKSSECRYTTSIHYVYSLILKTRSSLAPTIQFTIANVLHMCLPPITVTVIATRTAASPSSACGRRCSWHLSGVSSKQTCSGSKASSKKHTQQPSCKAILQAE